MEKNGNGVEPKLEREELTAEEALMLKFYRTLSEGQRRDPGQAHGRWRFARRQSAGCEV